MIVSFYANPQERATSIEKAEFNCPVSKFARPWSSPLARLITSCQAQFEPIDIASKRSAVLLTADFAAWVLATRQMFALRLFSSPRDSAEILDPVLGRAAPCL